VEGIPYENNRNNTMIIANEEAVDLFKNARIGGGYQGEQIQTMKQCMAKTTLKQKMRERLEAKKAKESKI
jgi:hypothetical protein